MEVCLLQLPCHARKEKHASELSGSAAQRSGCEGTKKNIHASSRLGAWSGTEFLCCSQTLAPLGQMTEKGAHPAFLRCFSKLAVAKHIARGTVHQCPRLPSRSSPVLAAIVALAAWPAGKQQTLCVGSCPERSSCLPELLIRAAHSIQATLHAFCLPGPIGLLGRVT